MTLDEIKTRLRDIEDHRGDDERAHSMEDEMVWEFIYALAHPEEDEQLTSSDIMLMALELEKSRNIKFNRWCA